MAIPVLNDAYVTGLWSAEAKRRVANALASQSQLGRSQLGNIAQNGQIGNIHGHRVYVSNAIPPLPTLDDYKPKPPTEEDMEKEANRIALFSTLIGMFALGVLWLIGWVFYVQWDNWGATALKWIATGLTTFGVTFFTIRYFALKKIRLRTAQDAMMGEYD